MSDNLALEDADRTELERLALLYGLDATRTNPQLRRDIERFRRTRGRR